MAFLEVSAGFEPATSSLPMRCTANCATRPWRFRQDLIPTRRPFKSPPGNFSSPVFTFTTETYESFYLHSQDRATLSRPHRTALPCFVHKLKGSGDYPIIGVELSAKTHHFTQASTLWFIQTRSIRRQPPMSLLRRYDLRQRLCSYHSDQLCMAEREGLEPSHRRLDGLQVQQTRPFTYLGTSPQIKNGAPGPIRTDVEHYLSRLQGECNRPLCDRCINQGDFSKSTFHIADVCDVCCQSPYYVIILPNPLFVSILFKFICNGERTEPFEYLYGGPRGNRTLDLMLARHVLSQN